MSLDAFIAQQDRQFDTFRMRYAMQPHIQDAIPSTRPMTDLPGSKPSDASLHSQLKSSASAARITTAILEGFPHERGRPVAVDAPQEMHVTQTPHPRDVAPPLPNDGGGDAKRFSRTSAYAAFREILVHIDDDGKSEIDTLDSQRYSYQQGRDKRSSAPIPIAGGIQIRKLGPAPWQMDDEDSDLEENELRYRATERAVAGLGVSSLQHASTTSLEFAGDVPRSRTASGESDPSLPATATSKHKKKDGQPRKRSVFGFMKRVAGSLSASPASDLGSWSRKGSAGSNKTGETSAPASPIWTTHEEAAAVSMETRSMTPPPAVIHAMPVFTAQQEHVPSTTEKALPAQPLPKSESGQAVHRLIQGAIVFEEPLSRDRLALAPAMSSPVRRIRPSSSVPQLPATFETPSRRSSQEEVEDAVRAQVYDAADDVVQRERAAQHAAMVKKRQQDRMSRMFDHIVMQ
ncbi:hypothetical protein BCR37DRAFT_388080 [Protomyces lactucae-debilis]|uniref:Uncharacterized protein n=1 Tax=Protomyces lactucae-debilis TaxID=2754530 RepID=A0A1Y2FAG7_PROLT|nr:uncharacterized protein BCR37DRAFT_388080 [Protomyces lactucae-debilis]ORY80336.1 hypothetical protein BCR37DRAFT_388080 [Protomyces lactucae-debilis]